MNFLGHPVHYILEQFLLIEKQIQKLDIQQAHTQSILYRLQGGPFCALCLP